MPPSNKRRIWEKKLISASNKRRTPDTLTADTFALVFMKLSGFFHRVNFSRNSRDLLSVWYQSIENQQIESVPLNKNTEKVNLSGTMFK